MSDADQVSQALAELWDMVKCCCDEAYTGRGLHDPYCQCDSADAVQTVADHIEALTKERDEVNICAITMNEDLSDLSDELRKAVSALRFYARRGVVSPWVDDEINEDGGNKARATLAEIKGESHDPL